MKKNKLTMQCSCGNDQAWLITVKGGRVNGNIAKPHQYFICCGKCDAEIELGLGLGQ